MNERIKQLAEQATHHGSTTHTMNIPAWYLEKFAELMVEEFQTILRNNRGEDTGTLSYRVEEHFRS
jgi:hypothetical protein